MTAILHKIDDPRDALEKMTRSELAKFGKAHGVEVNEEKPAILIRHELRTRGLGHRARQWLAGNVQPRVLGAKNGGAIPMDAPGANVNEANATDDLARQWSTQKTSAELTKVVGQPAVEIRAEFTADVIDGMDMASLRKACKASNIPMVRTDNMQSLREKLKHG